MLRTERSKQHPLSSFTIVLGIGFRFYKRRKGNTQVQTGLGQLQHGFVASVVIQKTGTVGVAENVPVGDWEVFPRLGISTSRRPGPAHGGLADPAEGFAFIPQVNTLIKDEWREVGMDIEPELVPSSGSRLA